MVIRYCSTNEKSAVSMVCLDELNVSGLVSAQAVVRKLAQIETAIPRNPEQPDFEGLDLLTTQVVDEKDGVSTPGFLKAIRQNEEAQDAQTRSAAPEEKSCACQKKKKPDDV